MKEITFGSVVIGFTEKEDGNQRILENRKISFNVLIPNQKHTNLVISAKNDLLQEADGLYTSEKGLVLGVLTADCIPIVLFNQDELSVIHAGWRGLFRGIVEKAFSFFYKKPTFCFIGPSIRVCCYEVGKDFLEQFEVESKYYIQRDGRYFLSLQDIAKEKLRSLGLDNIQDVNQCTACSGKYFSFRKGDFDDRILSYAYIKE
ncbi:MAG: polyphenol oxidase family protein [Hydrogenothermaceae bacterium]|nr:polyphenol oxidase family protein [Hydrogenothermaceae bacterium]